MPTTSSSSRCALHGHACHRSVAFAQLLHEGIPHQQDRLAASAGKDNDNNSDDSFIEYIETLERNARDHEQVATPVDIEQEDTSKTSDEPTSTAGMARRSDIAALTEEFVIHWAEQESRNTTEMIRLEPWQRWKAEKMVEYDGDLARYHDWEALIDWLTMRARNSVIGMDVRQTDEVMKGCMDSALETLNRLYREEVMNGMTDEEKGCMSNPEMSGETKVYMLKRIVYREVFRFKDLSEEDAERDVIVRKAMPVD